ncbi:hypothetical protein AFGD_008423 [Aspergillus flavus]|nr:hypothetical protein AFGD_008423 [Aspergillus flavus]
MPANGTEVLPPLLPVTPEDHGPWMITVSTILLIVAALTTIVTLVSRLLFVSQTTCVNLASSSGIGKHRDTLSDVAFQSYDKFLYASHILSVLVLACSKVAVALLLISIKPFNTVLLACKMLLGLIGAWTITFTIALAIQYARSPLSRRITYDPDVEGPVVAMEVLPNLRSFWATLPIEISVPVLTIPYIFSLRPVFHSVPLDEPWHILMPTLWFQLLQSASIICTCIPSLKRVFVELQTGMMAGTVSEFFELSVSGAQGTTDGSTSISGKQSANATEHSGFHSAG